MKNSIDAPKPPKAGFTLETFKEACGSIEAAAALVGVSTTTYHRWEQGAAPTKANDRRRLDELGIRYAPAA